nr:beta-ketoacyl synthase [Micromonospora sp. DSM 115978]
MTSEAAFKPLARTDVTGLGPAELDRLARGDVAGVFGPAYDQDGANPAVGLAAAGTLRLGAVHGIDVRGGPWGRGSLRARLADQAPVV